MPQISIESLHGLIEAYFNARLDERQEAELRRQLAVTRYRSPQIDEARAVMGIFAMARGMASRPIRRRQLLRRAVGVAAAIAVIAVGTVVMMRGVDTGSDSVMVAYSGGEIIRDTDVVMAQMSAELAMIGEAAREMDESVAADLAEFNLSDLTDDTDTNPLNFIIL